MPRRVEKGTGMMKREVLTFDAGTEGNELFAHMRANPLRGADETRQQDAVHCRAELAKAYAKMDPVRFCRGASPQQVETTVRAEMAAHPASFVRAYYGEAHAYALMQAWLDAFDRLSRERARLDPSPAAVVMHAEVCGRLQERLYWRAGVDPDTQERREELALGEKAAVDYRRAGGAASASAAAPRRATAERPAHEIAAQRTQRLSRLALAKAVHAAWPDGDPPSVDRLRKIVGQA